MFLKVFDDSIVFTNPGRLYGDLRIEDIKRELATVQSEPEQKSLMKKSGEIIAEILDDDLETTDTETTVELNFALLKFKHTIKKKKIIPNTSWGCSAAPFMMFLKHPF